MRYVVVMGRVPFGKCYCAFCTKEIDDGYTREVTTRIRYCSPYCYEAHVYASNVVLGGLDAPLPKLITMIPIQEGR